jgi:hypothetical protein
MAVIGRIQSPGHMLQLAYDFALLPVVQPDLLSEIQRIGDPLDGFRAEIRPLIRVLEFGLEERLSSGIDSHRHNSAILMQRLGERGRD